MILFSLHASSYSSSSGFTVSTSGSGLNLRKGPGSQYTPVDSMDNGTTVDVYAYKTGWALVKYNTTWGWCSVDYLK